MAEHVDKEPAAKTEPVVIADLAGDWRLECALDLLSSNVEGLEIYVQMRLLIPADGTAASGGVMGVTRFEDTTCEEGGMYQARSVGFELETADLPGSISVLHATLADYSAFDPYTPDRFVGLQVDLERGVLFLDTDGEADRAPQTEEVTDPEATWGWFAEDPEARGVLAVWQGEGPG
jgi:hypothetical protein